jgi:Protein of unknown function (DUF2853)
MGRRDDLIALYAGDLREKCSVEPDIALLTKVTIGLGPAIYRDDSSTVAGTDREELETIRQNFLVRKLGLADGPELAAGIDKALDTYGRSNRNKHRAVVYYLLVTHFGRQAAYG